MRATPSLLSGLLLAATAQAATVLDLALPVEDFRAHGSAAGDEFTRGAVWGSGLVVADLDGDGVADLLASSFRASPSPDRIGAGAVHVVRGPIVPGHLDDIDLGADLRVLGPAMNATLGLSIAVGDLNDDGVPDLVTSSGGDRGRGEVAVMLGPMPWSSGTIDLRVSPPDWELTGTNPSDGAGRSIHVGDLNGDGRADLVVGIPHSDGVGGARWDAGEVRVFFGPLTAGSHVPDDADVVLRGHYARLAPPAGSSELGSGVLLADVNGDGQLDLVLGMPNTGCPSAASADCRGSVGVVFGPLPAGSRDLLVQPPDVSLLGRTSDVEHALGLSLAVADMNADGNADLIIGSAGWHPVDPTPLGGEVDIVHGPFAAGSVRDLDLAPPEVVLEGTGVFTLLAADGTLAVGDVDGDGVQDIVAGGQVADALGRDAAGQVTLRLGPFTSGPFDDDTADVHVVGRMPGDQLGSSVVLHDLDGDGKSDLVLGAGAAERPDLPGVESGALYVLFGEPGNRPPHCVVPSAMSVECGSLASCPAGRLVQLDGSASWDADQDLARHEWTIACGSSLTMLDGAVVNACLPVTCDETCDVTLTLTDARGNQSTCATTLGITDHAPPTVSASPADMTLLWSPNHRLVRIGAESLHPVVLDDCDPSPTWSLVGCTSDQPEDDRGDGAFEPDCVASPDGSAVLVRAERSGVLGDRRVTLLGVATDACGNASDPTAVGEVLIPHDRRGRSR